MEPLSALHRLCHAKRLRYLRAAKVQLRPRSQTRDLGTILQRGQVGDGILSMGRHNAENGKRTPSLYDDLTRTRLAGE